MKGVNFFQILSGSKIAKLIGHPVVQYSTVQYSTVQYSTVQYSTHLPRLGLLEPLVLWAGHGLGRAGEAGAGVKLGALLGQRRGHHRHGAV